ncbi:MAG: hypothetical protein SCARUB_02842 [Candidatus Scalindua rubra]|uniref:Antitoxin SocA-like Panacea domain-containing protein n=1 Tax=Candidatus Scalindua rubra TaxID=1872076 RepID=A0A1E3X8T7_9BACT|nr:MAG: hypothetical protein SCARUB_02842 [Candidatus Scalindua rubra]
MKAKPISRSKNAQIIKFIVERLSGKLGRTHLFKLIYLADYHSHRLFGESISTFNYRWYQNGPFNSTFYDYVKDLEGKYIKEEVIDFPSCRGYVYHNMPKRMRYSDISEREFYILVYVINTYGKVKLQTLLDEIVYKTEPMEKLIKKKAYGKSLKMKIVDNLDKELYEGLNPEDIIAGEKALQQGKVRPLAEVFGALQS